MLDFFQLYSIYIHACMAVGCDYMLCIDICVHSYSVHKCALGNALAKNIPISSVCQLYSIRIILFYYSDLLLPYQNIFAALYDA